MVDAPAPPPPTHPPLVDSLAAALGRCALERAEGPDTGPAIVRAARRDDGVELGLLPLPAGTHPAEVLTGMVVPAAWEVVGVLASGTSHRLDDASRSSVAVTYLLDRQGRSAHRIFDLRRAWWTPVEGQPGGLLPDLAHRALGLATPPPTGTPDAWLELVWLDRLVNLVALDPAMRLDRRTLRALHPLVDGDDHLRDAPTWDDLRRAAVDDDGSSLARAVTDHVPPSVVSWHDVGSLARSLEAELPPRVELMRALDVALAPPARRVVRATARGCRR